MAQVCEVRVKNARAKQVGKSQQFNYMEEGNGTQHFCSL